MNETKGKSRPFGIPQGSVTSDNPDGVSKSMDSNCCDNSLYDARFVGDGMSYGAFPMQEDYGFTGPDMGRRSNGAVTEVYKK